MVAFFSGIKISSHQNSVPLFSDSKSGEFLQHMVFSRRRRTFRMAYDELAQRLRDSNYMQARQAYEDALTKAQLKGVASLEAEPTDSSAMAAFQVWQLGKAPPRASASPSSTMPPSARKKGDPFTALLAESWPYDASKRPRDADLGGMHKMFIRLEASW